jgi:lysine 2,3-aminomutase
VAAYSPSQKIPRDYAALIDPDDPRDPIAVMVVPDPREADPEAGLSLDPMGEEGATDVPGLVHRYPDRVLLLVTGRCASHCRFCMRRRLVGRDVGDRGEAWLGAVAAYLDAHPGVREVILSGGDPLTLSDAQLDAILTAVRRVEHVQGVRVDTRVPVVRPSRVTGDLAAMLRSHAPSWVVTHFDHPRELTEEAVAACGRLVDAGVPVDNQAVLLAGVNDTLEVLEALCRGLLAARVRPYYLHQCDPVAGTAHFRTPLERGQRLVGQLHGRIAGLGVPRFAVDTPGGHGKVIVAPDTELHREGDCVLLRAPDGTVVRYPDV